MVRLVRVLISSPSLSVASAHSDPPTPSLVSGKGSLFRLRLCRLLVTENRSSQRSTLPFRNPEFDWCRAGGNRDGSMKISGVKTVNREKELGSVEALRFLSSDERSVTVLVFRRRIKAVTIKSRLGQCFAF
ncbi:hypothetical protein Rs2_22484 [Raphanus sativus]|nr:hypothetical protein Rs2_22484 [Raphanus sativus]